MHLPPIDSVRLPLVEPLGHLALQAAHLEHDLYEFVAMMIGPDASLEAVAHEMRNWNEKYLHHAVDFSIPDETLADDIRAYFVRVAAARERRHRMIHDKMSLGITVNQSGGVRGVIVGQGFKRTKQETASTWSYVEPAEVAALACHFYDLRMEIDTLLGRWRSIE